MFQLAVDNVSHFDYIGRVEVIQDSMPTLLRLLGMQDTYTGQIDNSLKGLPDNKYYEHVEREVVTTEVCKLLLANHAYDIKLYEVIKAKFG